MNLDIVETDQSELQLREQEIWVFVDVNIDWDDV